MSNVIEDLKYLSEEYESGEHVDISATNYFQEALDEIERLQQKNDRLWQEIQDLKAELMEAYNDQE